MSKAPYRIVINKITCQVWLNLRRIVDLNQSIIMSIKRITGND